MKRQDKYPDTNTFKFHNANPKGRYTGDCIYRAATAATGLTYETVCRELCEMQIETGYADIQLMDKYLTSKGFSKQPRPTYSDGCHCKASDFILHFLNDGHRPVVANIGSGHVAAIVDKRLLDTWDCTYRTVGNYWIGSDR